MNHPMVSISELGARRYDSSSTRYWAMIDAVTRREGQVATLSDPEIERALRDLTDWAQVGTVIERTIRFSEFMDGIRFIETVAGLAETLDHHPDIDVRYRNVRFVLTTHSEGGLTTKDIDLAHQIDRALLNTPRSTA